MNSPAIMNQLKGMRKAQSNLAKSTAGTGGAFGGRELLKMEKDSGLWVFGMEVEALNDTLIAVNPASFCHGIVAWVDSSIAGENMVSVNRDAPMKNEQVDPGLPWVPQVSFEAAIAEGPDKGTQLLYKSSAGGGREFVDSLFNTICDQVDAEPELPVAVLSLANTWYKNKKYGGKTYKPTFKVHSWNAFESDAAPDEPVKVSDEPVKVPDEPATRSRSRTRTRT